MHPSPRAHLRPAARRLPRAAGLTVLELIIVIAIIGLFAYVGYSGFRMLTHAALADDVNDLSAVLRRSQVLSVEAGMPTRVVFDFEKQVYWVEACAGDPTLKRTKEEQKVDADAQQEALEAARQRLNTLPAGALKADSPEAEAKLAIALAGKQVGSRVCSEVGTGPSADLGKILALDAQGRDWHRKFNTGKGVKLREVWVQHLESSVTGGTVSISFFPLGWAEKAIIELGDDRDDVYTIVIHGLTGRIEVRDGALHNPDDLMMRDAEGEREQER